MTMTIQTSKVLFRPSGAWAVLHSNEHIPLKWSSAPGTGVFERGLPFETMPSTSTERESECKQI